MTPRPFHILSPIVAAGLAWSLHFLAASPISPVAAAVSSLGAEASEGPAPKVEGSDWTWRVQPNGAIRLFCKGTVVMDGSFPFWGKDWAWTGVETMFKPQVGEARDGRIGALTGRVDGLKTTIAGEYRQPAANVLEATLELRTTEASPGSIGGGLQFMPNLASPVLGGRAPSPEIPTGGAGWSWEPMKGSIVRMTISPAVPKIQPEGGVRVYLSADGMTSGVQKFRWTLTFPEGATRELSPEERYDPLDPSRCFPGALAWDASPVDLRFLNADDRPAGGRGPIRASGDQFVRGDGTPIRFWGGNLVAYALFNTPHDVVPLQARRMAQMGFNLMRLHHHDSNWVSPNVFGVSPTTTRRLDPASMEKLDWWVKCLKDEGIYVWVDVHVGRKLLLEADEVTEGAAELARDQGGIHGYNYYNGQVRERMLEYQRAYLEHVNTHTGVALGKDPAVAGVLLTNENDLTHHFGNMFLADKGRPYHNGLFTKDSQAFAAARKLDANRVGQTWLAGPSKIYLNDVEHRFNAAMSTDLRKRGVQAPLATTNTWGEARLSSLPALTDGDLIDVHAYGTVESLGAPPRYEANYIHWIGAGQVAGRPLTVTEWNLEYPTEDRFVGPLYTAAMAAYQGWDAPMIYTYSQDVLQKPERPTTWSTFADPAMAGMMPAAALLFRRGQVDPARKAYHLALSPDQLFGGDLSPYSSATLRTAVEQGRLTIGWPAIPELPWLKAVPAPEGATVIDDPNLDLIPEGQTFVRSDTGQITRDWRKGVQIIDAPRCQAASGWIGGSAVATADARFEFLTKKAVVALNSVDDEPLARSRFILISTVARAKENPTKQSAFISEPVVGTIFLKTQVPNLELLALAPDGRIAGRSRPQVVDGALKIELPRAGGGHWYVLKAASAEPSATPAP